MFRVSVGNEVNRRVEVTDKVQCEVCAWIGTAAQILHAPSPFDADDILDGCPQCKSVNTLHALCDEPGCTEPVSCGTPTKDGYRQTCGEHAPEYERNGNEQLP